MTIFHFDVLPFFKAFCRASFSLLILRVTFTKEEKKEKKKKKKKRGEDPGPSNTQLFYLVIVFWVICRAWIHSILRCVWLFCCCFFLPASACSELRSTSFIPLCFLWPFVTQYFTGFVLLCIECCRVPSRVRETPQIYFLSQHGMCKRNSPKKDQASVGCVRETPERKINKAWDPSEKLPR